MDLSIINLRINGRAGLGFILLPACHGLLLNPSINKVAADSSLFIFNKEMDYTAV